MASNQPQSYENHQARDSGLIGISILIFVGLALGLASIFVPEVPAGAGVAVLGVGLLPLTIKMRQYSLMQQDRIIRLEMRLRLEKLLSGELAEKAKTLTLGQLIALRFASDEELPGLVEKVLNENITDTDAIKRQIQNWQPDFMRI